MCLIKREKFCGILSEIDLAAEQGVQYVIILGSVIFHYMEVNEIMYFGYNYLDY